MGLGTKIYNSAPSWFRSSYIGGVIGNLSGASQANKNLDNSSMHVPLQRLVQTIANWRAGTKEAEYYIPFRVKQQQLYNDVIDEPHVAACMERRMDLTLLRDYTVDCGNDKETEQWTQWLKDSPWFIDYQRYILTGKMRGYTLISIGNIVSNSMMTNGLPELKMLEHSQVSPDRRNFASVVYSVQGLSWEDDEYKDWHVYVDTPPEMGNAACGYGILHKISVPALLLRPNLTDNANYNEVFGQPVRWGKTNKTDDERTQFFNDLKSMGASATFVTDLQDEIEFIESSGTGQGYKTFPDLEMRCQKLISKNMLGHADVMDSIPKRSGSSSGDSNPSTPSTPVQDALSDIKSKDGKFVQPFVKELLDKLRLHGVPIPLSAKFSYKNDEEEELAKQKDYQSKQSFASIAKDMKAAGLQMDPAEFTKETGIACKVSETPKPVPPANPLPNPLPPDVKNKLDLLYSNKKHNK